MTRNPIRSASAAAGPERERETRWVSALAECRSHELRRIGTPVVLSSPIALGVASRGIRKVGPMAEGGIGSMDDSCVIQMDEVHVLGIVKPRET